MRYTPEQAQEIVARISELRSYWLRVVEVHMNGKSQNDKTESEKTSDREK
jgi:hypothetical protein